jgi:hypothetical protein
MSEVDRFEYEAVALFDRVREQLGPVPTAPLEQVVARGRRVRRARRAWTGAAALGLAAAVAVPVALTVPGGSDVEVVPAQTRSSTSAPSPTQSSAPTLAAGMLHVSDLGSTGRWTVGTMQGDTGPASSARWPGCTGPAGTVGGVQVAGTGSTQMYRGQTPEGREWIANETLLHLDPATAQKLAATARETAACTSPGTEQVLLATSPQVVVFGSTITEGPVGMATAVALSGTTLVSIDTLPGGAALGVGLPGQTQWLVDLVRTAVQRAGAPEPAAPQLTSAALAAAAEYAPSHVSDVPPVTEPPAPSGTPTGFLVPAEIEALTRQATRSGVPGASQQGSPVWLDDQPAQSFGSAPLQIPQCQGPLITVVGDQRTALYRSPLPSASPGSMNWLVEETKVKLSAQLLQPAREALQRLAQCASVTERPGQRFELTMTRVSAAPLIFQTARTGGGIHGLSTWMLSGDTLLSLGTYTQDVETSGTGGPALPVGVDWFRGLIGLAVRTGS